MAVQDSVTAESVAADLRKYTNVIVEGVAGCGKSHLLEGLREQYGDRVRVVVFHPATSYEDFVSGLRPGKDMGFTGEAGVFVEMCEDAAADPDHDYLLFIDEINRANTSRVFGDLMLVLEASKRADLREEAAEDKRAALLTERTPHTIALQTPVEERSEQFRYLQVPRNLHVLGTMNTTDRSVGTIDLALRRRFHWVTMQPLDEPGLRAELDAQNGSSEHLHRLITWYAATNRQLQTQVGPDARLGHSYFFGEDRSVEDVATDLLNQLKEVVATFNIHEDKIKKIVGDGAPVGAELWTIVLQGQGLGRRPEIDRKLKTAAQPSPQNDGSEASEDAPTDAQSEG
ncbi:McrB family protein [Kocuria sp.]|uniref:McrB family protein n=1 Tax=Kocuria sp. TaxID=1871328 RepID=UPI0026DB073F|nr:AAA family ATPase [Kocuria sp.]MDO4918243.1 AAA family ATPase [Kocuria sp.]